jgi:hypothetical protein
MNTASSFGNWRFFFLELAGELFEVHAADQFHADEAHALRLAEMVGLHDVRVNQVGDELGLADEVLDEHLLAREIRADDLDGHALALKNLADDFVSKIALYCEQRHAPMVIKLPAKSSPAVGRQKETVNFLCFFACTSRAKVFNSNQVT